jgi:S-(hydroxymethyl)glutathione dehydrogenase/alcohol dehydrogenase
MMTAPVKTPAAVLINIGQPLEIMELEIPELKPGQLLVDVEYAGVCHSQLHEVRGGRGPDNYLPHTLGHEGSGTVMKTGPGVEKVKPGDKVVLTWIKGEGMDVPGTVYNSEIGKINSGAISTFVKYTVTCENRVVPLQQNMPIREAALLGCAVPTGAGILINTVTVKPGSTIAIFGVGGIGLSALLAAVMLKASQIIAIDIVSAKLDEAKKLGATHVINAKQENVLDKIKEITGGAGVDNAIEAAGRPETMETAFQSIKYNGGLCVLAGNVKFGEKISLDPFDLIKGRKIIGTWGGETQPDTDLPKYESLFLSNELPFGKLVSNEWSLKNINEAFDALEAGEVSRALINLRS